MSKSARLGIVGTGRIAQLHLGVLASMPNVEIVGLTSRTIAKAQNLAKQYGVAVVADDLVQLVEQAKPDGLLILVSADQVYPVTSQAISLGLPLFIEKPAGLNPSETRDLAELANKANVKTMVGYNRRFYSVFRKGIEIIRDRGPLLGLIVEGHERIAQVRDRGIHSREVLDAWLYANSTHTIDLLRYFGGEISEIRAEARNIREVGGDQFAAAIRFESGTIGTYNAHWLSPGGWRVALFGMGVSVEFKPLEAGSWIDASFQHHAIEPDAEDIDNKPGFYGQMEAFRDLVLDGELRWPGIDLAGACKTMKLASDLVKPLAKS